VLGMSAVCLSVGLDTTVRPTKADEPIREPFGVWDLAGPKEPCVMWWLESRRESGSFWGCSAS